MDDDWISAWNILPPTSPTGLDMRDAFDAAFVQDSYLHEQWQRVLDAVDPPCRFESAQRTPSIPPPAPDVCVAAPRTLRARRLTDDVLPFEQDTRLDKPAPLVSARSPRMHARSVANFVRDMLLTHNHAAGVPAQYFSLGEVAQYFNNFIVDVDNNGPYSCSQLSAMHKIPELIVCKLWTFRPGAESFSQKQVASRLRMTPTEVRRAYQALGFKTWVL